MNNDSLTDCGPSGPPPPPPGIVAELVRLLAALLAGGVLVSLAMVAACRLPDRHGGIDADCATLIPSLEAKQRQVLETLVTLLAGTGIRGAL